MEYSKLSLKELKDIIFNHEFKRFPYLNNFKKNPYTYLKARYYMYGSTLLLFFLLKSPIKPNTITIIYGLLGIMGGILLSIPNLYLNILSLIIFFNKGILDWTDGHLARIKYEPTLTGHILDIYGATLSSISLIIGLGFFAFHQTGQDFLIYLIAITIFFNSEVYTSAGKKIILESFNGNLSNIFTKNNDSKELSFERTAKELHRIKYPKLIEISKEFLDDSAKSVDFILLIILFDLIYSYNLTFYIFLILSFKIIIRFVFSFIYGVKSEWAEELIKKLKIKNLNKND